MVNPDSEEEFNSDFQNFLESDSLSNSQEAVRSEKGDNGMRGLRGLRGITGPQGLRGDAGTKGDAGDTGKQGEQGERGEIGPQGIQGLQGVSGVAGSVGEKGEKGDRGQQGLKGDSGPEGVQGAQGDAGEQGERGERGEKGEQGEQGVKGDAGERGEQGESGVDGVPGQDGLQGAKGERGAQGVKGEKGETGVKGDRGEDGSAGAQGDKGAIGEQGATGDSGIVTAKYPLKYDPKKKIISIDTTRLGGGSVSKDGGGGGLDTAFKTVSVSGQSDLNAVQYAAETLSIVAGSNITLTTDSASNSLTISSSGGGGTAGGATGPQGATGATGPQGIQGGNAGRIYYLWAGVTADVAGYKTASVSPSPNAITSITTTVVGTGDVFVASFITDVGEPGVGSLPTGIAERLIHAYQTANNGVARLNFQLWKRDLAGTETLLRNGYSENFSNETKAEIVWTVAYASAFSFLITDRLVFKVYAARVSGSASFDVITSYEGEDVSYVKTTISAGAVGPQGATGATGSQGVQGATGSQGATGTQGVTGPVGDYVVSFNGLTGAVAFSNYVTSVNGVTGAIVSVGLTSGKLSQFASTTSAELAGIVSDETGSGGVLVFNSSPSITTALNTASASFNLLNTTATTLTIGSAATTGRIFGYTGVLTATQSVTVAGANTGVGVNKTVNIGTGSGLNGNVTVNVGQAPTEGTGTINLLSNTAVSGTLSTSGSISAPNIVNSFNGSTGAVVFSSYVASFNGLTGAVTGVTAGGANTFTALNSFSAGISASALTVGGGATFSGTFSGATAAFSKLLTASEGISAGGNVVFNAVTALFGASAANTTPITVYKDNSADNPAVDDGFGNTSFDTPNNKVPLTLSFTEVYDPNTGLTASTPGSTMIRVRDQTAGLDTFTVTDSGNVVCGNITCGQITPTSFGGNLSIGEGNSITLNYGGTLPVPTVLSVYNTNTSANALTLKGDGTFSQLGTTGSLQYGAASVLNNSFTLTTGATGATTVASFTKTQYRSFEFDVQGSRGTTGPYQLTKILAVHDGTTVTTTQLSNISTGGTAGTYTVDISGTLVRLRVTPGTTASTVFKTTVKATPV